MDANQIVLIVTAVLAVVTIFMSARAVPNQWVYVVERLGKYQDTLQAGFHIIVPFLDKVVYKHSLDEMTVDVPSRTCITKNRISVEVDSVLYIKVVDPVKASYGTKDYRAALIRMAGTTMCSEIGKITFDVIFESRENLNSTTAAALDEAAAAWGVEVIRCEIKDIKYEQFAKV